MKALQFALLLVCAFQGFASNRLETEEWYFDSSSDDSYDELFDVLLDIKHACSKALSLKIELPFGPPNKENAGLAKIVKCQAEKWILDNQKTFNEHGYKGQHWTCSKKTWPCASFFRHEQKPGGDPKYNIYADKGALYKYDCIFGEARGKARSFELEHNRIAYSNESSSYNYSPQIAASIASCLLTEPHKSVTLKGTTLTPTDIQGLLCKVMGCLQGESEFIGNLVSDRGSLWPHVFHGALIKWARAGKSSVPFLLFFEGESPSSYAFDSVFIFASSQYPPGFIYRGLKHRKTTFYRILLTSTGYPEATRNYQYWIEENSRNQVLSSEWIEEPQNYALPEFLLILHPKGDLRSRRNWQANDRDLDNPHIKLDHVFTIFHASTGDIPGY